MEQPGWRVVILSSVPHVAATLATTLRRLGHSPAAVVRTPRLASAPGAAANDSLEKQALEEQGLEVLIADEGAAVEPIIRSADPDLAPRSRFPWRLTPGALAVARLGSVNYPSLVPRHRAPNPLGWNVRCGDPAYGVTWHRMEGGLDTGPILAQRSSPVAYEETLTDVISRLSILAVRLLPDVFERLAAGEAGDPQPAEGVTEAPQFGEDYAAIDWSRAAQEIHTQFGPGPSYRAPARCSARWPSWMEGRCGSQKPPCVTPVPATGGSSAGTARCGSSPASRRSEQEAHVGCRDLAESFSVSGTCFRASPMRVVPGAGPRPLLVA